MPASLRAFGALLVVLGAAGCSTTTTSNTARTASEQLLISNAVDQALDKVDFGVFAGQRVFLDDRYLEGVDKSYVVASLRHRLLVHGATVAPAADGADVIVEARSGGLGTDSTETFYGFPEFVIPGMVTIPELKLATRTSQRGTAKLGLVAWDAKSRTILGQGGMALAVSDRNDLSVLGIGPYRTGTVRREIKAATGQDRYQPGAGLPQVARFEAPPAGPDSGSGRAVRLTGHDGP